MYELPGDDDIAKSSKIHNFTHENMINNCRKIVVIFLLEGCRASNLHRNAF